MSILASEQLSEQIIIASARAAVTVTASLTHLTRESLTSVLKASQAAFKRLPSSFHLTEGKMSLKRLQKTSGGDLHTQEVSDELKRTLQRDLKKRGVDFSVEKGRDGKTYVHFKGADIDTLNHAFTQAQARLDSYLAPGKPQTRADLKALLEKKTADQKDIIATRALAKARERSEGGRA